MTRTDTPDTPELIRAPRRIDSFGMKARATFSDSWLRSWSSFNPQPAPWGESFDFSDKREPANIGFQLRRQRVRQAVLDLPYQRGLTDAGRPEDKDQRSGSSAFDRFQELVFGFD